MAENLVRCPECNHYSDLHIWHKPSNPQDPQCPACLYEPRGGLKIKFKIALALENFATNVTVKADNKGK